MLVCIASRIPCPPSKSVTFIIVAVKSICSNRKAAPLDLHVKSNPKMYYHVSIYVILDSFLNLSEIFIPFNFYCFIQKMHPVVPKHQSLAHQRTHHLQSLKEP